MVYYSQCKSMKHIKAFFPQMFCLINVLLSIPMSTATVERSFSQMKLVKNRLWNRLSDVSLAILMRVAIEGPELTDIDFEEILNIFKLQNRIIRLWISLTTYMNLHDFLTITLLRVPAHSNAHRLLIRTLIYSPPIPHHSIIREQKQSRSSSRSILCEVVVF